MKPLYRTAFFLQRPPASLDEIAAVVEEWVFMRQGRPRPGLVRPEGWSGQAIARPLTILGAGWSIETAFVRTTTQTIWAVQVQHPDSEDSNLCWTINLTASQQAEAMRFTCEVGVAWIEDRGEPISRRSSQPNIVIAMLQRFGGKDAQSGRALSERPYELKKAEVAGFVDFLVSPGRQHTVVLITRSREGQVLVEPELWARKLGSLAYVMVAEAWDTTFALEEAVGSNRLVCWGGSIRIYRPGFTKSADPYGHPLLSVESLQTSLELKGPLGVVDNVVGQLAEVGAHRPYPGFTFWEEVQDHLRTAEIRRLQSASAEDSTLAVAYAKDVEVLERRVQALEADKLGLRQELEALREWRRLASEGLRRIRAGEPQRMALRHVPEVNNLTEAVEVAAKELKGKVLFALNSKSDLEAPFAYPTDVLTAIRWLAGPFWESKALSKAMGLPEESLKKVLPNWSYAGNQTTITMGRYEEWYRVDYALPCGRKAYAEQHLKFGVGADPANMIRVGFLWDEGQKVWVIGYIGPHQRNTKS